MLTIQKYLNKQGKTLDDRPLFRLVWSDEQTEVRSGEYNEFYNGIFLRTTTGTLRVPKYPFIKERWILEKWIPPERAYTPELPESRRGSYEPLYVFEKDDKYLEPTLKVVQFMIEFYRIQTSLVPGAKDRINELINAELAREEKEVQEIEDSLEVSPITNALHMHEAVGYKGSNS